MIKTILLILIIYYSVRFISRLLLPFALKFMFNKAQKNMRPRQTNSREGDVTIDKNTKQKHTSNSSVGEYVDFEEIDDKS
jgi:hypothetical protein